MAPSWGQDAGAGAGLGFCNLSHRLAGRQGRGSYFALLVLSSVGGCPDRNLTLDGQPMLGRVEAQCRGVGKREVLPLISWVPSEGRGHWSLQATFNSDRFA